MGKTHSFHRKIQLQHSRGNKWVSSQNNSAWSRKGSFEFWIEILYEWMYVTCVKISFAPSKRFLLLLLSCISWINVPTVFPRSHGHSLQLWNCIPRWLQNPLQTNQPHTQSLHPTQGRVGAILQVLSAFIGSVTAIPLTHQHIYPHSFPLRKYC